MLFKFVLECTLRRIQTNQEDFKFSGRFQFLGYTDVNVLGESIHPIKENTEALLVTSKEVGLKGNAEKTVAVS